QKQDFGSVSIARVFEVADYRIRLNNGVRHSPTITVRTNGGSSLRQTGLWPVSSFKRDLNTCRCPVNLLVEISEIRLRWNNSFLECQNCLYKTNCTCTGLQVPDIGFNTSYIAWRRSLSLSSHAIDIRHSANFNRMTNKRGC